MSLHPHSLDAYAHRRRMPPPQRPLPPQPDHEAAPRRQVQSGNRPPSAYNTQSVHPAHRQSSPRHFSRPISTAYGTREAPAELPAAPPPRPNHDSAVDLPEVDPAIFEKMVVTEEVETEDDQDSPTETPIKYDFAADHYGYVNEPLSPPVDIYSFSEKSYSPSFTSSRTRASSHSSATRAHRRAGLGNQQVYIGPPPPPPPIPNPYRNPPPPPRSTVSVESGVTAYTTRTGCTARAPTDIYEQMDRQALIARQASQRPIRRFGIGGAGNSIGRASSSRGPSSTVGSSAGTSAPPSEVMSNPNGDSEVFSQYSNKSLESGADKLFGKLMRPMRRKKVEIIEEDVHVYWSEETQQMMQVRPLAPRPLRRLQNTQPMKPGSKTATKIEKWVLEPLLL